MAHAYYALGLNFHQPYGNLVDLHATAPWEATQVLLAYERSIRYFQENLPEARLHIAWSGTLLMQLTDPDVQERFQSVLDLPKLLRDIRACQIEFLGSGYTHPVFPLIPVMDWQPQLSSYLNIALPALGRTWLPGFWPPEMGFCMEMIPHLKRLGYRYVVVDNEHIEPLTPMRWDEIRYRPHTASFNGEEMIIVPRDREISNAQLSGFDPGWFAHEVGERTRHCVDFPALVTAWSDGENGGWFRNSCEKSNFWGWFYKPMLDWQRNGTLSLTQISINEYLDRFGAAGEVKIRSGAWNTGDHSGRDFTQWTGSLLQKRGIDELHRVSARYYARRKELELKESGHNDRTLLDRARWHILRAETSCNFYWGSRWVHRAFDDLEEAERLIDQS